MSPPFIQEILITCSFSFYVLFFVERGTALHVHIFKAFLKKLFNWRIIALPHCDGFCHTSVSIGHRHTRVPRILSPPPTCLPPHPIQGAGSGCPASYIKLVLKYISFLYSESHFTGTQSFPNLFFPEALPHFLQRCCGRPSVTWCWTWSVRGSGAGG